MKTKSLLVSIPVLLTALSFIWLPANAEVSADQAARLKTDLTPLGGERAGNADGTIPAWTGGYTTPIPGDRPGGKRGDPFKDEKPLFSITPNNVDQYSEKLTDGTKAMFKKFPETYRMDVYATHRTAAAPSWVYDNTLKNATVAKMEGDLITGAFAGVPFPIPKSGEEVLWNHVLRWRAPSYREFANQYVITTDGRSVLSSSIAIDIQMPYYYQEPAQFKRNNEFWMNRLLLDGPANRAGEASAQRLNVDGDKTVTWLYLPGQRRVRKLPNVCCDTPNASSSGVMFSDEIEVWTGRLDQFDWKIAGKKEMYIPYNENKQALAKSDSDLITKNHLSPDYTRWELHRVWVVDATLRQGQRHQSPKGRYYCDEDTWICVLGDRWDAKGQLWRTLFVMPFIGPDLPGVLVSAFGITDLLSGGGFIGGLLATKSAQYEIRKPIADTVFTPEALSGEGVR